MEKEIKNIKTSEIESHPSNPRKDLGDLTELTESIKKNGIMQNLTVIPKEGGGYRALIGHRRLAAAKAAGIEEVPAIVLEGTTEREQVGIMLEENIQRNDLTVIEQAEGFQMMLDLGETEQSIAEKTGFSRSTIRRRLEIAKLDTELVEVAMADYQFTLSDFEDLQKVEDVEERNKILAGATSKWMIESGVNEAIRKKKAKEAMDRLKPIFEEKGIEQGKGEEQYYSWKTGFCVVEQFDTQNMPEKIEIKEVKKKRLLWAKSYQERVVVYYINKSESAKMAKEDKERQESEEKKEKLNAIEDKLMQDEKDFILMLIKDKIKIKKQEETWENVWKELETIWLRPDDALKEFLEGTGYEDEDVEPLIRAIIAVHEEMGPVINWDGSHMKDEGAQWMRFTGILKGLGFTITKEQTEYLMGTHELFAKE